MPGLVPWALGLLASGYVLVDLARSEPLLAAPFYGAGLLLAAELTYASRELARGREERPERRAVWLAAVAAAALAVASIPVAATAVTPPTGLAAELIAVARRCCCSRRPRCSSAGEKRRRPVSAAVVLGGPGAAHDGMIAGGPPSGNGRTDQLAPLADLRATPRRAHRAPPARSITVDLVLPVIIIAVVAIPILVLAFVAARRRNVEGEQLDVEDDAERLKTEQEFADAERYQEEWREEQHKHPHDERFP